MRRNLHILGRVQSVSIRVDVVTHEALKRLAAGMDMTVGETVAIAARRLRQERIGSELRTPLTPEEVDWLDADVGEPPLRI